MNAKPITEVLNAQSRTAKGRSLKRSVIRRTWTMDAPSVTDKVVIATARAYGYRGKNADTASDVLERNGYQMIPW